MLRRSQITMTATEIQTYLKSTKTLIVISNGIKGFPHPMPMWFAMTEQGEITMTTFRRSQKVTNIQRDPNVSLLAESGDTYTSLKSVLIYAMAAVIDDLTYTIDVLWNVSLGRGEVTADQEAKVKPGLAKMAAKRVSLRFEPMQYISWDHGKLGGKY